MGIRDVLVALIVFGSLPFIFKRAQIGVMMWVWISVMNPHRLSWGFSYDFHYAAIIAVATLVSALISKDLKRPPANAITVLLFLFVAWTGVTTVFALYLEESFYLWKNMMKTQVMAFLIPMLFHKKEDLRLLLWVIVLSIAYYGTKGGIWILLTGGGDRVYGPESSYVYDNNALAVAVIMLIPLMRYLQSSSDNKNVRRASLAMILLCGVAAVGSYSRGALVAITAMFTFLWWKSRNKVPVVVFAILMIPLLFVFMPEKWRDRMETMTEVRQDGSMDARLNAWATMFNLANDRPLVGGGFNVAEPGVYARYSPDHGRKAHVAHSIYFQALGEHGYVGLALYLLLFYTVWRKCGWIMRETKKRPDLAWARDFSAMLQVSLVGFAVGGAFLSLVNYDVPYYLVGIMVATLVLVEKDLKAAKSARTATAPTGATAVMTRREAFGRPGRE